MYPVITILGRTIPSYGFMITLGVLLANVIAYIIVKKEGLDINDLIIQEAYLMLGAFGGAKIFYLIISFRQINWKKILNFDYFNSLLAGGFVFYGGMIGGFLCVLLAGKIHGIDSKLYIKSLVFLMPFTHCFGRIGCFLTGCCFGIPYHGFGAVTYPHHLYGFSNVPLFPVQLVEAFFLLLISIIILYLQLKHDWQYTLETYFLSYSVVRFILEFLRYDDIRGHFLFFSTSQWISLICIFVVIFFLQKTAIQKQGI